jgi:hypothetical protein
MGNYADCSLWVSVIAFLLSWIPFVILNAAMAKRKGRSRLTSALLSLIPVVGFFLACYLVPYCGAVL